jgi:hypothetical protein
MASKLLVLLAALALAVAQETTAQSGRSLEGVTGGDLGNSNDALIEVPAGGAVASGSYILDVVCGSGDGVYPMGAMVIVSADSLSEGQKFARWAGDIAILSNPFLPTTTAIIPSMNVSIIATYGDPQGATSSELWRTLTPSPTPTANPTPTSTPTPTPTPQEDDCVVESITVEWHPGNRARARLDYIGVTWLIVIKGEKLKKCEFTQFISANTQLWDPAGKELKKEDVLAAYKASEIKLTEASGPFAKNEKDDGWGEGEAWRHFTNDNKEKITDVHDFYIPHYMSGTEKKYYAYRITREMVVKVRKKGGPVLKELEWSYDLRNYFGDSPKAPIEKVKDTAFYDYRNIKDVPWDKKKK